MFVNFRDGVFIIKTGKIELMEEFVEKRSKERRIGQDRRTHEMDEYYRRAVAKKIVKERRKNKDRRITKRRLDDNLKRHLRIIRKRGEEEFLDFS